VLSCPIPFTRHPLAIAILAFAMALGSAPVSAQISDIACNDIRGVAVLAVADSGLDDLAFATLVADQPLILYRTNLERIVAPPTVLFVVAHECAHEALGHVLRGGAPNKEEEIAADCWAIEQLHRQRLIDSAELQAIERDVARFGVADDSHLPGAERARALAACFDAPRPDLVALPVAAGKLVMQPSEANVVRAAGLSEIGRD
jgi:hypothetical protein